MGKRIFKTGFSRDQAALLPARVEDYVRADNSVRAIDAYVGSLDLGGLGFTHAQGGGGAGQPAYDPADLLKLDVWLPEPATLVSPVGARGQPNVEVMWLRCGLTPGYRTAAYEQALMQTIPPKPPYHVLWPALCCVGRGHRRQARGVVGAARGGVERA